MKRYRFDDMATAIYRFTWGTFCDWYIEFSKPILFEGSEADKAETRATLGWVLGQLLHILHPIMPFITEEIWQNLAPQEGMLITNPWPLEEEDRSSFKNIKIQERFNWVIDLVTAIRGVRNEVNVPAGAKVPVTLVLEDQSFAKDLALLVPLILKLARLDSLTFEEVSPQGAGLVQAVIKGATAYLAIHNVIDIDAEKARLQKNLKKVEGEILGLEKKLSNKRFVDNAPVEIITKNKERLSEEKEIKDKLNTALSRLA